MVRIRPNPLSWPTTTTTPYQEVCIPDGYILQAHHVGGYTPRRSRPLRCRRCRSLATSPSFSSGRFIWMQTFSSSACHPQPKLQREVAPTPSGNHSPLLGTYLKASNQNQPHRQSRACNAVQVRSILIATRAITRDSPSQNKSIMPSCHGAAPSVSPSHLGGVVRAAAVYVNIWNTSRAFTCPTSPLFLCSASVATRLHKHDYESILLGVSGIGYGFADSN